MLLDFLVIFATQSGQAQRLAEDLHLQLCKTGFQAQLKSIDRLHPNVFLEDRTDGRSTVLLFLISTASQGQLPMMAESFFQGLATTLRGRPAARLRQYSVFGLGDSRYSFFNYGAKKFVKQLSQLGLRQFVRPALGDNSHAFGPLGELDVWMDEIVSSVRAPGTSVADPRYDLITVTKRGSGDWPPPQTPHRGLSKARLLTNVRMTSGDQDRDVRYLSLELPRAPDFGDLLFVWPRLAVSRLAALFQAVSLDSDPAELFIQSATQREEDEQLLSRSLLEIFTQVIDVTSIPSRAFLARFATLFKSGPHRRRLKEMSSAEADGLQAYMDYIIHEHRSIAEVVVDFSLGLDEMSSPEKMNLLINFLVTHTPRMAPRAYSIASAPHWFDYLQLSRAMKKRFCVDSATARRVSRALISSEIKRGRSPRLTLAELCVAVKEKETLRKRHVQGLCSTYLASLKEGEEVWVDLRPGPLTAKWVLEQRSQLLLGCGTGVAPLRGLMQHFYLLNDSEKVQNVLLGFRHPHRDFLFKYDFTKELVDAKLNVHIRWSRLEESGNRSDGGHIQDSLSGLIWYRDLLRAEDTAIVIAGRSHPMPREVLRIIDQVAGNSSRLLRDGRLIIDTWGE